MTRLIRSAFPALLVLAAACGGHELRQSDLYGTWRLAGTMGEPTVPHPEGEILQLTPGAQARYEGEGVTARGVGIETFHGQIQYPVQGGPDEGLLFRVEDDEAIYWVGMPDRSTLVLTPNDIYGAVLTYRRAR